MSSDRLLVAAEEVTKRYRRGDQEIRALAGISLALSEGEIVLIRGKSGSGKTTFLNILAGWEVPDSGSVTWSDVFRPGGATVRTWEEVSVIPQALGLLTELPLDENVALPQRLLRTGATDGSAELLRRLEIEHLVGRPYREAALGEQQRAAVARALVVQPRMVLADEPTAHQDRARLDLVWTLLHEAAAGGACVLVASHNPEAADYADRICGLVDGRLVHD